VIVGSVLIQVHAPALIGIFVLCFHRRAWRPRRPPA
jgi:hypothetical protein